MSKPVAAATAPVGLRERRRIETRLDIARAATHLVGLHGMNGTTVEMIAERAGISPRTFFNYFPTKAEAVLARTVDAFAALPGLLDARPAAENPLVAVREAFCEFAVIAPTDGSELWAITESDPDLRAELDRIFESIGLQLRAILAAHYPQAPDAAATAEVAIAMGFAVLGLAFRDSVENATGTGISSTRLRERFDVLGRYPLTSVAV
jgi:AcrR family transcriptional regulator